MEDKGTWRCPVCGTSWRVESRSIKDCYKCGYEAKSYTAQIRSILAQYRGAEVSFDFDWGRKGRRKMRPLAVVGTYQWIYHNPKNGFMIDVLVSRQDGKKLKYRRHHRYPLRQIKPWGAELEKILINLDLIVARKSLPEAFPGLPAVVEVAG